MATKTGNLMKTDSWQLNGKLEIVPPFEQNEIDHFFKDIDVLLFPSQWKESFGLTVREAISRNVWVIATDCGGPIEDLINGENGEIVAMDDIDAFRTTIVRLLHNPACLANYQNPYPENLRYFSQQAAELNTLLGDIVVHTKKAPLHS